MTGKENKKILITSALPYVNNVPHLGNIVGAVLSADVFARFCRSQGYETIYVCGTDEHGTATETKALEEGVSPKEICDKYYDIHKRVYEWFNISFDDFGRTSTPEQTELTQDIFLKLYDKGYIVEDTVEQLYCRSCDKFLADRFVEGTCPYCGYEDARGDQCDNCSRMLNATELKNPRCKVCSGSPEIKSTEHLFIDLPKLKDKLLGWIDKRSEEGNWSNNAKTMTYAWISEGLKRRAISRDLKWGVPIPLDKYKDKVFYVWFDAPIGYLSITKAAFPDTWELWWKDDQNVRLYQFMGKDNVPFHTIIFPASLIGSGDPYTMLYRISSTEYLNYENGKFSKSRGVGVFGLDAVGSGVPSDVFRYYLLVNRPEKSDSSFHWHDLMDKNNNELVATLGNLVNRTMTFTKKFFDKKVPAGRLGAEEKEFLQKIKKEEDKVTELLGDVEIKEALKQIMHIAKLGNNYFQKKEPWKKLKEDPADAGTSLHVLVNIVKDLAIMIEPYLPESSASIYTQLGIEKRGWDNLGVVDIDQGHELNEPKILFNKLEQDLIDDLKSKYGGKQTFPLDLRVAKVTDAKEHPDADKLLILQIDLGEKRQLVAGLKEYYKPEDIVGKHIVIVSNLKKAKLKGVESQGMLLAASKDGVVTLIEAGSYKPGDQIKPEGMDTNKDEITIDEFAKVQMTIKDKKLAYGDAVLGDLGADMPDGSSIS